MLGMAASLCRKSDDGSWDIEKLDVVTRRAFAEHVAAGRASYWLDPSGALYPEGSDSLFDWWDKPNADGESEPEPVPDDLIRKLTPQALRIVEFLWGGKLRRLSEIQAVACRGKDVKPESVETAIDRTRRQLEGTPYIIESDKGRWWLSKSGASGLR